MTEVNVKDSLANAHQGAVLSAVGAFGDKFASFFSEPAKHLGAVVSRLGVGAAIAAVVAVASFSAPGEAHAQQWGNAAPWGQAIQNLGNNISDQFRTQRQADFANQAAGVVAEQRGLDYKDANLARLAAQAGNAFVNSDKAPLVGGALGIAAAMLIPGKQAQQPMLGGSPQSSGWSSVAPWGSSVGTAQQGGNPQTAAVQQAYARFQQISEPQFQAAIQANLDGDMQARDRAIAAFGSHWNAASQMGIPLHTVQDQVAKFQMLGRMNNDALMQGLQMRVVQPQVSHGYGQ